MMLDKQSLIALIQQAFQETEHPGDAFLQGSDEGCEPAEVTAPFKGGRHWSQMDPALLDPNYTALSFFSEGGFRHFLPAYLIADGTVSCRQRIRCSISLMGSSIEASRCQPDYVRSRR